MSKTLVIGTIAGVLLVFALGGFFLWQQPASPDVSPSGSSPSPLPSSSVPGSTVYENQYMKFTVLGGWVVSEADTIVFVDRTTTVKPAVNNTKGDYILSVDPLYQHASGIVGGRFSELTRGLVSFELVMENIPKPAGGDECATIESRTIAGSLITLEDYYTARNSYRYDADRPETEFPCHIPVDGVSAWFGSATSGAADEAFGRATAPTPSNEYAITLSYSTVDPNKLPKKGSQELNEIFDEVNSMLQTLRLK